MIMPVKDWRDDVAHFLITAGTAGRKWSEITARFQSRVKADPLKAHLAALLAEEKVQHFKLPNKNGQETNQWRATTKILKP